ncbi:MAG: GNAT family N-acetyltransferase [Planctomycetota bacterium]
MRVEPRDVRLGDGRGCTVRSARPRDAGRILDHARDLTEREPEHHLPDPGELELSVEGVERFCRAALASPSSLALVAVAGGEVVGFATLQGTARRKTRHVAETGVGVRAGWRRAGLGRALLETLLEAARGSPVLRKVSLRVFATNAAALSLYERLGFVLEGRRRAHVRVGDDFVDELLMGLFLRAEYPGAP